jgi:hypothetical protein
VPLGYRAIFTVTGDQGAADVAASQFRSWLRHKGLDADATTPGLHEVGEQARLVVTELHPQNGSDTLRYRLTESTPAGEWTTTLTAREDGRDPGWIWVDVNAPPFKSTDRSASDQDAAVSEEPAWTAVPRLVRNILSVTNARDGELELTDRPNLVRADEFDELVETICDPARRGAAILAAPVPGVPMSVLLDHVEQLTRHCVGLAGIYVLDEDSAEELARSFGVQHGVPFGALRTYLPGVDPASTVDARRHRIMLARTIAAQPTGKLARTLGWATRTRSMNLPLPPHILRIDRLLAREEPAAVLRSIRTRPDDSVPAADGVAGPSIVTDHDIASVVQEATEIAAEAALDVEAADREVARTTDGRGSAPVEEATASAVHDVAIAAEPLAAIVREFAAELSEDPASLDPAELVIRLRQLVTEGRQALRGQVELSKRVAGLQDALDEVQDERDEIRARLEDEQLDHAVTQEELTRIRFETDHFRAALAAASAPAEAWVMESELPQPPASFEDLLARLDDGALPGVMFTGDARCALDLDVCDPFGTWAAKTWEMLRAVDGYVQARQAGELSNGMHAYLGQTPPGRPGYSAGAHASQESESVEQSTRFRSLRELPVPYAVFAAGKIFMGAHFKIAKMGTISPRMHYFDDTANTGKVYVGYIGRHLPNTLTN